MTEATVLALVAIVGSVVAGLFKLLTDNTKAQSENTKAMKALVAETRKGNVEAAQRNGHLGEQNENITSMIIAHAKESQLLVDTAVERVSEIVKGATNIEQQNVKSQTVERVITKE